MCHSEKKLEKKARVDVSGTSFKILQRRWCPVDTRWLRTSSNNEVLSNLQVLRFVAVYQAIPRSEDLRHLHWLRRLKSVCRGQQKDHPVMQCCWWKPSLSVDYSNLTGKLHKNYNFGKKGISKLNPPCNKDHKMSSMDFLWFLAWRNFVYKVKSNFSSVLKSFAQVALCASVLAPLMCSSGGSWEATRWDLGSYDLWDYERDGWMIYIHIHLHCYQ